MKNLTEREKQVVKYLAQGFDNNYIGEKLNITIHTVKVHIKNIKHKLEAKNRTEVAYLAGKYNLAE